MGIIKGLLRYGFGNAIGGKKYGNACLAYGALKDAYKKEQREIASRNYENVKSTIKKVTDDLTIAVDRDFEYLSDVQRKILKFDAKMIAKNIKYDNSSKIEKQLDDWNMVINFINYVDCISVQILELIEKDDEIPEEQKQVSRDYYDKISKTVFIYESKKFFFQFYDYLEKVEIITDKNFRNEIQKNMDFILNS